ncbi:hypothetical protein PVM14_02420 [Klebsiella quasipneumoniae]|uniref:hypothetical protein n=1 Tax=Klebsiella quasipneumoniae TaxID=1463165 RepID=UPI002377DAD8|nr:hypothetical protein [Klebsiella quasipneumoniae]MDD9213378.1 hypothetical protein [Klebsiella quasipneumoniae]
MTTAFGKTCSFWAVDSRWSYKLDNTPDDTHPTQKFVVADSEITIFAGDENPILVEQAVILELITHEQYFQLIANLTGESLESITVSEADGSIIDFSGSHFYGEEKQQPQKQTHLHYIGSGGSHACDYFYYSCKKKKFLSSQGCNVLGAMSYASYKDRATGGATKVKIWTPSNNYGNVERYDQIATGDIPAYHSYVSEKVHSMLTQLNQQNDLQLSADSSIPSARCSSSTQENGNLRKVSFASAVRRQQNRDERKRARAEER